ncbi:hypothetical protein M0812_02961 [Anaeramoeba flamelloides]|uniref:Uncharacterized protein n=1 Tax=Anaeramoeba flamelloides TaxID=1746091 RepID=A0AAV7YUB2_9EUKA|nr:hypothetical protein M0812_02961 [Anaeramoeba flamelloides]
MDQTNNIYFWSIFWDFGKYLYTNRAAGSWVNFEKVAKQFSLTFFDSQDFQKHKLLSYYLDLSKCLLVQNAILLPCESSDQTHELSIVWSKVFLSDFTTHQPTSKLANQILKNPFPAVEQQRPQRPQQTHTYGTRRRLRPRQPKKTNLAPTKSEHEGLRAAKTIGFLGLQLIKILQDRILTRGELVSLTGFSRQRVCSVLSIYKSLSIIQEDPKNNLIQLNFKQANLLPDLGRYLRHVIKIRRMKRELARHVIYLTLKYQKHGKMLLDQKNQFDTNLSNVTLLIFSKIKSILSNTVPIGEGEHYLNNYKTQFLGNNLLKPNISNLMEENEKVKRSLFNIYYKDLQKMKESILIQNENSQKSESLSIGKKNIKEEKIPPNQFLTPLNSLHPLSSNNPSILKENFQTYETKINKKIKNDLINNPLKSNQNPRQAVIIPLGTNKQIKKTNDYKKKKTKLNGQKIYKQEKLNYNSVNQNFNKPIPNDLVNNNNNKINNNRNHIINSSNQHNFDNNQTSIDNKVHNDQIMDFNNKVNNTNQIINNLEKDNNNFNHVNKKNDQSNFNKKDQQSFSPKTNMGFVWSPKIQQPITQQNQYFFLIPDISANNKINSVSKSFLNSPSSQSNQFPLNQNLTDLSKINLQPLTKKFPSVPLDNTSYLTINTGPDIGNISTTIQLPNNQLTNNIIINELEHNKNDLKTDLKNTEQLSPHEFSYMMKMMYQQPKQVFGKLPRNYISPEIRNNQRLEHNQSTNQNNRPSPNSFSPYNQYMLRTPNYYDPSSPLLFSPFFGNLVSPLQMNSTIGINSPSSKSPYLPLNLSSTPSLAYKTPFSDLQSLSLTKYPVSLPKKQIQKTNTEIYETSFNKK